MSSKPRELYMVTYPGHNPCALSIIPENLYSAERGHTGMQASIAIQFFKELGYPRTPRWSWEHFNFTDTGEAGSPPRHARDADVEWRGCTCTHGDCANCQMGLHESCTYYCQFGQVM